jgi:dynein heavy chain
MKPMIEKVEFSDATLKKAGKAALGIGSWVKAIIEYDQAMKIVKPKQAELKIAKETAAAANKVKEEAEARLAAKEAELKACVDKLDAVQREEKKLRDMHDDMQAKKALAEMLINSLKGEREAWDKSLNKCREDKVTIEGDILICSGIMAYLGVFVKSYRTECVEQWCSMLKKYNIQASENVNLTSILGQQVKIVNWNSNGLPSDEFSVENAIILDHSERWSLAIDPQMQANKWLK